MTGTRPHSDAVFTPKGVAPQPLVINQNPWVVPGCGNQIEGKPPTPEMRAVQKLAYQETQKKWTPGLDAWALVERIKDFVDHRVRIQFWDPIMEMLEDEGPYLLEADCSGVVSLTQNDGVLQAYVQLENFKEIVTRDGCSSISYLEQQPDSNFFLAPIRDILEI